MNEGFDGYLGTPVGVLGIRLAGDAVADITFLDSAPGEVPAESPALAEVKRQLGAYFRDPAFRFSLPVHAVGTPFRQRVWQVLTEIPPGQTLTYGELARRLGSAPRAVGGACGANPVPLLIPCHRVVGVSGLGGYGGATGGGQLEIKRWLLRHEGAA